ncbi:hypothetical protein D9M68_960720 [compost metagenome]
MRRPSTGMIVWSDPIHFTPGYITEAQQLQMKPLKKQLTRSSTSPEKLRRYWEILLLDRNGLEGRYPLVASDLLPKQILDQMHKLSAEIDVLLQKE